MALDDGAWDKRVVAAAGGDTWFIRLLFVVTGMGGDVLALVLKVEEMLVGCMLF